MTFQFAHMAPPGAVTAPAHRARVGRMHRLVMHRDRAAIPAQPEPAAAQLLPEPRVA